MRLFTLVPITILVLFALIPVRTPDETLRDYFAAISSADTIRARELTTETHWAWIETSKASYFARQYETRDSLADLRDSAFSDSIVEITFRLLRYHRNSGLLKDSAIWWARIRKENGDWKLDSAAYARPIAQNINAGFDNLGFERSLPNYIPAGWETDFSGSTGQVSLDSEVAHSGHYALHLVGGSSTGYTEVSGRLAGAEIAAIRGKRLSLRVWMKRKWVSGYTKLWWGVFDQQGMKLHQATLADGRGTDGWRQYSTNYTLDSTASSMIIDLMMGGTGDTWFDDVEIDTNATAWKK